MRNGKHAKRGGFGRARKQAKEGEGRERNCRKELAAWPRQSALVKTAILRRLCLAVTRLPAETDVSPRSSPLGDVSHGGTSVTQRQKSHADDVNLSEIGSQALITEMTE